MVGDSLITKIQQGLKDCEYMGVVLTPESVSSPWVEKELEVALTEEIIGSSVIVLPILYKDCDIPGFLKGKVYADFRSPGDFDFSAKRLTSVLGDTGYGFAGDHPDDLIKADLAITKIDFIKKVQSFFLPRKSEVRFHEDGSDIDRI